jgi:hypothetical protein
MESQDLNRLDENDAQLTCERTTFLSGPKALFAFVFNFTKTTFSSDPWAR